MLKTGLVLALTIITSNAIISRKLFIIYTQKPSEIEGHLVPFPYNYAV